LTSESSDSVAGHGLIVILLTSFHECSSYWPQELTPRRCPRSWATPRSRGPLRPPDVRLRGRRPGAAQRISEWTPRRHWGRRAL